MSHPSLLASALYTLLHEDNINGFNQQRPDGPVDMRGGIFEVWIYVSSMRTPLILLMATSAQLICAAWTCALLASKAPAWLTHKFRVRTFP